jgi:hypothetical protein
MSKVESLLIKYVGKNYYGLTMGGVFLFCFFFIFFENWQEQNLLYIFFFQEQN